MVTTGSGWMCQGVCCVDVPKALGAEVAKEKVAHHAMLTQSY